MNQAIKPASTPVMKSKKGAIGINRLLEILLGLYLAPHHRPQPPAAASSAITTVRPGRHPSVAPGWPDSTYGDSSLTEQGAQD